MAQVRIASGTKYLYTPHAVARIRLFSYSLFRDWLVETGPAAARVKLGIGIEQLGSATGTVIDTRLMKVAINAGERVFGGSQAADLELLWIQLLFPFRLSLIDFHSCLAFNAYIAWKGTSVGCRIHQIVAQTASYCIPRS